LAQRSGEGHLDKDFDVIAAVTGQPIERLNVR